MTTKSEVPGRVPYVHLYATAFRWVWRAAPREFAVSVVAQVIAAAALSIGLLFGRDIVQRLTTAPPLSLQPIAPSVLGLAAALVIAGLSLVMTQEVRVLIGELVARCLEGEIIEVAGSVAYEQFERQDFHDLLGRAHGYGAQSSLEVVYYMLNLINALLTSAGMVAVLAASVPQILPSLLIIAAPFLLAARASARLAFRTAYDLTPQDRLRYYLYGALVGKAEAKEVRVFDLRRPLVRRWTDLYSDRIQRMRGLVRKRAVLSAMATVASAGLVAAVLVVIVRAALLGSVSLADAGVAVVALQQLSGRLRGASESAGSLRASALFLDDFGRFQMLRREPIIVKDAAALQPLSRLRLDNVSFRYPGTERPVLHGITLEINKGEVVALVGVSGSGKTTLAHLVAGLYEPDEGAITWDGKDIRQTPKAVYWRSLAVVFQDFARYQLDVRENIAMGDYRRIDDLAAVREAARRAGISSAIEELPAGYDSMLSRAYDDGVDLSVGQWQRVAVARAFFRDASLLILDEPAAALDPLAEQRLYERVEELCTSRSVLLISHRFSTVRLADRIYVMQDGRIVEHGSHAELMELDGHYGQLFRAQAAGYVHTF